MKKVEIWKDIIGYDGDYKISNFGRVKSYKIYKDGRILKHGKRKYLQLSLCKNGKKNTIMVHILVWDHFGNVDRNELVVDHINNDKTDNRIENLQLLTNRENCSKDKWRKKTSSKYIGVSFDEDNKKWRSKIYYNKKSICLGRFQNEIDASNAYQKKLKEIS